MNDLAEQLALYAERTGLSIEQAQHLHMLQGVLRRWVRSQQRDHLVLGGSLLTQLWVGPTRRTTADLDFVGLYPPDASETFDRFRAILALDCADGIVYDLDTFYSEGTWRGTAFPGTRARCQARLFDRERELRIDVGCGFPLVPPIQDIDYPCLVGPNVRVPALRPELLVAWKLDGLFEHGPSRWLPKGLFDLCLLLEHCDLDQRLLVDGIRAAFESKSIPLESVLEVLYNSAWWEKPVCRNKWARFLAERTYPVPESLLAVATRVARALRPALEQLITFPAGRVWLGDEQDRPG